jgi:hypothetical protein
MGNDTLSLVVVIVAIIAVIIVFVRVAIHLRKYGGSLATTMFAATYEFLNKDKREAVEEIVEMKANKKMEEESSDQPKNDFFNNIKMKGKYYILWYRLDDKDSYLIWYSNSNDRILTNKKEKILNFSSKQELNEYAFENALNIEPEEPTLHNLDAVVEWIKVGDEKSIDCNECKSAWNLFEDVSQSVKIIFDSNEEVINNVYDKLFWGCNLPSVTPKSKSFNPEWNKSEINILKRILSNGIKIFKESLNAI